MPSLPQKSSSRTLALAFGQQTLLAMCSVYSLRLETVMEESAAVWRLMAAAGHLTSKAPRHPGYDTI